MNPLIPRPPPPPPPPLLLLYFRFLFNQPTLLTLLQGRGRSQNVSQMFPKRNHDWQPGLLYAGCFSRHPPNSSEYERIFIYFFIIYLAYTVTPCDGYDITSPVQDIYWLFFIGIELS